MWFAPALAGVVTIALGHAGRRPGSVAAPILLSWSVSALLMWWLGHPRARNLAALSHIQRGFLRRLSRRTWGFFEVHVDQANHWLPPDNVQEHPELVVARRTSPTNIGLALLANLSAYDFGYLSMGGAITRVGNTLSTLDSMARHNGHFYNWYDTETLQPLLPHYVSSVDSGNLAATCSLCVRDCLRFPTNH